MLSKGKEREGRAGGGERGGEGRGRCCFISHTLSTFISFQVVSVVSISCVRRLFGNQMEHLRNLLHSVATHLSLGKDRISREWV